MAGFNPCRRDVACYVSLATSPEDGAPLSTTFATPQAETLQATSLRRDHLEASVSKKAITAPAPRNRVAEKSSDPEAEPHQFFDRKQQPVDPRPQHLRVYGGSCRRPHGK